MLPCMLHVSCTLQESDDDPRGTTGKDAIFDRDYSAPTGEDKFNKEILPKVMQVRLKARRLLSLDPKNNLTSPPRSSPSDPPPSTKKLLVLALGSFIPQFCQLYGRCQCGCFHFLLQPDENRGLQELDDIEGRETQGKAVNTEVYHKLSCCRMG